MYTVDYQLKSRHNKNNAGCHNVFFFSDEEGEKRIVGITPRLLQLRRLAIRATGLNDTTVNGIINYGCWCGPRGQGIVVDNFD